MAGVSVVIGSNGTRGSVEACLAALAGQVDDVEVIVCEPAASDGAVQARFPFARFLERKGGLVPELWRDGIEASSASVICLTISIMRPTADWVATARSLAAAADGTGGAIEPAEGLRLRDSAEYFCRYARDMLPFEEHECLDLPGDNAVYRREALEAVSESYLDGFWEPEVHRAMDERSNRLVHSPVLIVHQGPSAGFRAFARQRWVHGRAYGTKRGMRFSSARNVAGVVGAPLVPLVLTSRVLTQVLRKRRHRRHAVLSLPLILLYDAAWAAGEAAGHIRALRDHS